MQKDYLLNQEKQAEKAEKEIKAWGFIKPCKNKKGFVTIASKRNIKRKRR